MLWSFRIGRVFGIPVRVHASFVFAALYFASAIGWGRGLRGATFGTGLSVGLCICLALHEYAHCLVARYWGLSVREIVLVPMGGTVRLSREPRKPTHELWCALAGPAANLTIALALYMALRESRVTLGLSAHGQWLEPSFGAVGRALFWANVALGLWNLLPALPMDGGHAFRALLSLVVDRSRATQIAAWVGQAIAVCLVVIALDKDWSLLGLVALYVFFAAARERATVRARELLAELRAGEVCDPHAVVFSPEEQVGHVLDTLVRCPQAHFAVFSGKELVGTLARDHALALAPRVGLRAPLSSLMRREFFAVDAGTPLDEVHRRLRELGGRPVVVRSLTGYAGVLGGEDLERIILVAERLAQAGIRRPEPTPDPALH
jgi:Zn-dependent protease